MCDVDLSEADKYVVENVYTTERRGLTCAEKISQIIFDVKKCPKLRVFRRHEHPERSVQDLEKRPDTGKNAVDKRRHIR